MYKKIWIKNQTTRIFIEQAYMKISNSFEILKNNSEPKTINCKYVIVFPYKKTKEFWNKIMSKQSKGLINPMDKGMSTHKSHQGNEGVICHDIKFKHMVVPLWEVWGTPMWSDTFMLSHFQVQQRVPLAFRYPLKYFMIIFIVT